MNNKETTPIAIVMGRNYASRLGMIRAAGLAGCEVIVIQTQKQQKRICKIDASSKYVRKCYICNEPYKNRLIDLINSLQDSDKNVVLLPTDDFTAWAIDEHYDCLKDHFLMPTVNDEQGGMAKVMDKESQKRLAREIGMNVAEGWVCTKEKGAYQIPADIVYPCFTKPIQSYNGPLKQYLKRCDSKEELAALLEKVAVFYGGAFLVEEYHEIEKEYAVVGLSIRDKVIIPSVFQMLSDHGGVTATGRIFPISKIPSLEESLSLFVRKTQLLGMFDIDLYESGGKLYFNEFNARLGASAYALTASSVNLPSIFINYLVDGDLHEEKKSVPDASFVNEKTLLDQYFYKEIRYCQYKHAMEESDIFFLKDENDMAPFKIFIKYKKGLPSLYMWRLLRKSKNKIRRILKKQKS